MTHQWFIVHTRNSSEKAAEKSLLDRISRDGMQHLFERVLVPTLNTVELKDGQKKISSTMVFPGYILVKMILTDESWHLVKNTPKVSGFLGGSPSQPSPIPQRDIDAILESVEMGEANPQPKTRFCSGDSVRIKGGAFADSEGVVEQVIPEKNKLRVNVSIFGRSTPVELDYSLAEKC